MLATLEAYIALINSKFSMSQTSSVNCAFDCCAATSWIRRNDVLFDYLGARVVLNYGSLNKFDGLIYRFVINSFGKLANY